jgi:hypothetical protein
MKIEHSPIYNDFLSFFFETTIDGEKRYSTVLDYLSLTWTTEEIASGIIILSGPISRSKDQAEEKAEQQRIRNVVTAHLRKTQPEQ